MSTATLRRHFVDLDSILFELLMRHLHAIAEAVGKIPTDTPNIQAARRAAYLAFTRTGYGAPTEAHLLLIRERHGLPEDLADPIEAMRQSLGVLLAGAGASAALALLDIQDLQAPHIEAMLAAAAQVEATQSEIAHLATAPCATIQPETAPPAEAQPALAAGLPQQVASETPPPAGGTSCDVDHLRQLLARSFPGLADPLIAAAKHRPIPGEPPGIWPEKSIRARAGPLLAGSAL